MGFIDPSEIDGDEMPAAASALAPIGGRFIDPSEIDPDPAEGPSLGQSLRNEFLSVGNRAVEGVADLASFAQDINPFQFGGPRMFGLNPLHRQDDAGDSVKQVAEALSLYGDEKAQTAPGRIAERVAYFAPSIAVPGGPLAGRAAAALGSGLASGVAREASDDPTVDLIASLAGGVTPALAGRTIAPVVSKVGKGASETGRKLELSAFGATKARIARATERAPDLFDDAGNAKNPISDAIESFRADGGGKAGMSGEVLMRELDQQRAGYIRTIGDELRAAQSSQRNALIPAFRKTEQYVDQLAGVNKDTAKKLADELIQATVNNTDGTLLSLQNEKVKLSEAIRDGAWGKDSDQIRTNVLKRIRSDLRTAVEDGYEKITGKSKKTIADLNNEIGKRDGLRVLFKDIYDTGEARDPLKWIWQQSRTSGGLGAAMVTAASAGAGLPVAAAIPVVGGLVATPSGRRVIGDTARRAGAAASAIGARATNASQKSPGAALSPFLSDAENHQETADVPNRPTSRRLFAPSPKSGNAEGVGARQSAPKIVPLDNSPLKPAPNQDLLETVMNALVSDASASTVRAPRAALDYALDSLGGSTMSDSSANLAPLVEAVILQESNGNPNAVSDVGALGLMQVMPATARDIAKELGIEKYDLKDPETNRLFGTHYLQQLLDRFDGDVPLALTAYHSGPNRVARLLKEHEASTLEEILPFLGPVGRKYASGVISKLSRIEAA